MKYPGMQLKNHNDPESSQGNILKITMKYPGIQLKYPNEIPRLTFEISQ
jgi:hypothetical protein